MKKGIYLLMCLCLISGLASGQNALNLSFTFLENTQHLQADSVVVTNQANGTDTTLYYPDSVLVLQSPTTIHNLHYKSERVQVLQNFPNPFSEKTTITILQPKAGVANIEVFNALGQRVANWNERLPKGTHQFLFYPGNEKIYLLKVSCHGKSDCIKMTSRESSDQAPRLRYSSVLTQSNSSLKSAQAINEFSFVPGDKLLVVAYSALGQSGFYDVPTDDTLYQMQFATNIPCLGIDSLEYAGQVYQTLQVYNQCWMAENLNVGLQLTSGITPADNDTIEKYCLLNDPAQCVRYGGLYIWDEMMNYSTADGAQGICPEGWHIASDEDFKILEGAVDSYYPIGHVTWNALSENGNDVGKALKSTEGWANGGNGTNDFGFNLLWGGFLYLGNFAGGDLFGTLYTSSEHSGSQAIYRGYSWMWNCISRQTDAKTNARPIRCVMD